MYQKENYRTAAEILAERRRTAEERARDRYGEIHARSARISEIDRELAGTGLMLFGAACSGEDITPIRRRTETLQKERRTLLLQMGYPENYTDVDYTCKKCSDTGYTDVRMCSCLRELLQNEAVRSSGLGRLIGKQTFENFNLSAYREGEEREIMLKNFTLAKTFAENVSPGEKVRHMLMTGKTGTGKTHLSTAIAALFLKRGYSVLYDCAQNILDAFEADRFRPSYNGAEKKGDRYLECDLLILDDLGTEFSNSFTDACFYNLINYRLLHGLPTVISSNLSPIEISERYSDRLFSRLCGNEFIQLYFRGEDHRMKL